MIIIHDEKQVLNLNHTAIYLMLSSADLAQYDEKLKKLNDISSLTRNLFSFYTVEKGNTPYEELPDDMIGAMRHYNVMIRLVNSIHGKFCYAMEEIDLANGIDQIVKELNAFVDSVCKEDINQLEILCARSSNSSIAAVREYNEYGIVREVFDSALYSKGTDMQDVRDRLQDISASSDMATSLGLASSAVNKDTEKAKRNIMRDHYGNKKPLERPSIGITIKNVETGRVLKNGKRKKKFGVEFNINGNIVPVDMGGAFQIFIYIAILFAYLEGITLSRYDFRPLKKGRDEVRNRERESQRDKLKQWLRKVFTTMDSLKDFDDWYNNVEKDTRNLDQALSRIRDCIWDALSSQYKDAYYYCIPVTKDGRYRIRGLHKEEIKLDPCIKAKMYGTPN